VPFPEPTQGGGQGEADVKAAVGRRTRQRRPEVVVLPFEPFQPGRLVWTGERGFGTLSQLHEVARMAGPDFRPLAGCFQLLLRELADRLQHAKAGIAVRLGVVQQQAVVHD